VLEISAFSRRNRAIIVAMIRQFAIAVSALAVLSIDNMSAQQAQTPAAAAPPIPAIEVASVKLSNPNAAGPLGQIPIILPQGPGRITTTNTTLRWLVRTAYGVQDFNIVGGPAWMNQQRFDIVAKAEDSAGVTDTSLLLPILKSVLIDRFKLKTHTEKRELPIESLVVARSDGKVGANLKPSTADCKDAQQEQQKRALELLKGGPGALAALLPKPGEVTPCSISPMIGNGSSFGLRGNGQSLLVLVQLLTGVTGKNVQDKTGLTGLYDFELTFDPADLLRMVSQMGINLPPGVNLPQSDSPSLLTAVREQLGLKLDSDRGPVEVLVIDSAEMPMPD
jgi:uncharacterized protein (TIGR03435 family)